MVTQVGRGSCALVNRAEVCGETLPQSTDGDFFNRGSGSVGKGTEGGGRLGRTLKEEEGGLDGVRRGGKAVGVQRRQVTRAVDTGGGLRDAVAKLGIGEGSR
jgi:hypothetical protein